MSVELRCSDSGLERAQPPSSSPVLTDGVGCLQGSGTVTPGSGCPGAFSKGVTLNSHRDTDLSFSLSRSLSFSAMCLTLSKAIPLLDLIQSPLSEPFHVITYVIVTAVCNCLFVCPLYLMCLLRSHHLSSMLSFSIFFFILLVCHVVLQTNKPTLACRHS